MSWPKFWTNRNFIAIGLLPISKLVCFIANKRLQQFKLNPPYNPTKSLVIVVGNIVVGGAGKTPFIQWLATLLQNNNIKFGVISRGYGGKSKTYPLEVLASSSAKQVGDEPLLLAKNLQCPIVVAPKRIDALRKIMQLHPSLQVIISDDGLQHFALPRQIEIVLFDSQRNYGNGYCMPSGPLREPINRLSNVDAIVCNGHTKVCQNKLKQYNKKLFSMTLKPVCFRQVCSPENILSLEHFEGKEVLAIAGIGNPQRFFNTLKHLAIRTKKTHLKDHQTINKKLLDKIMKNNMKMPLLMTQKDAVKCQEFAPKNSWYLEILPQSEVKLSKLLLSKIKLYS